MPLGGTFVKEVCPILGAVATGVDTALMIGDLMKLANKNDQAAQDVQKFFELGSKDRALLNSLQNEKNAREHNVTKKSVEMAGQSLELAGDVTKATGALTPVGVGLKAVGRTIKLGNKIVFANIEWAKAQRAMQTLEEARAGSPIARMEIFEDSATYAKMYLCILARDGHPLAKSFIEDRGITEGDLSGAMGLKVLREALMKDADQKDEEVKAQESRGGAVIASLIGQKAKDLFTKNKKKIGVVHNKKGDKYKSGWKHREDGSLHPYHWETNKAAAVKDFGLYYEKTGIKAALEKYSENRPSLLRQIDTSDKTQEDYVKTMNLAKAAIDKINAYCPVSNDGKVHTEFVKYLTSLKSELWSQYFQYNDVLYERGFKTKDWSPSNTDFTKSSWDTNWKSIESACMISGDDGVSKAFAMYEKANELAKKAKPKQPSSDRAKYRFTLAAVAKSLKNLAAKLNACHLRVAECPPVMGYIEGLISDLIKHSQEAYKEIMVGDWDGSPVEKSDDGKAPNIPTKAFKVTAVSAALKSAHKNGFITNVAPMNGVINEMAAVELNAKAYKGAEKDHVNDATRSRMSAKLKAVLQNVDSLKKDNPDTHPDMKLYFRFLENQALSQLTQLAKDAKSSN